MNRVELLKDGTFHPTQKPVKLYEWVISRYAKAGDKILDTHAGSGACLVAAHRTQHEFLGFEIDADYFKKAAERIETEQAQMTIFDFIGGGRTRRIVMKFYHAAPRETMEKIVGEGKIRKSWDGEVYLCKKPEDSCKFLVIRGMRKMSVIEVDISESSTRESHDHSEAFFRCKAYMYDGDITLTGNERVWDYEFDL